MEVEGQRIDGKRLGRRPPSNKPALMLADILQAIPTHPGQQDYISDVNDYGLYQNDQFGDCGPVSVANFYKIVSLVGGGTEISVTQDDVFDLYRRSGNPNFDPSTGADDNGVDMQTMLEALLKGGVGGHKPIAFAKVDVSNLDEVRAALAYFGGVLFGVDLEVAQQNQSDPGGTWDYSPSGDWGGHAIVSAKYTSQVGKGVADFSVVSWGEILGVTDAFCENQLQEAWVVVWPEHLTQRQFLQGVDQQALANAYHALTGKVLPAPIPAPEPTPTPVPPAPTPTPDPIPPPDPGPTPTPPPDPGPTPDPGAAPFPGATVAVSGRIRHAAARKGLDESTWMNEHFEKYFHLLASDLLGFITDGDLSSPYDFLP